MSLHFYNTLTRKKEEFKPLTPGIVRMYTCGPTVYNYAHIGNLRAYVFADVLRRTLEYNGYEVKQVMNITDIGHLTSDADEGDDKMVKALKREGKPMTLEGLREIADKYTGEFVSDLKSLNIKLPSEMPKASEHIEEDIALIERLAEKGIAYTISDGVYFDVSKFSSYGTRGGFALGELKAGTRVVINEEKRTERDFSLWKFSKSDIGWESPWGRGFPGWHIECSAMSLKYLGQPFDIHTGGIDHIPTHHQNEIAQSEAAYGVPLANVWMHNEYLIVPSGKMAKSGENFITLQTLKERGIHPLAYRYYLLQTHYRSPLNFSWGALEGAQAALERVINRFVDFLDERVEEKNIPFEERFQASVKSLINDDLNTPGVLGLLNETLHGTSATERTDMVKKLDALLGFDLEKLSYALTNIPENIVSLRDEREKYRAEKNWAVADKRREEIESQGYRVYDPEIGRFGVSRVLKRLSLLIQ